MDARDVARLLNLGRVALGAGLTVAPQLLTAGWVGRGPAGSPAARVLGAGLGARDLGLGLGTVRASTDGSDLRPWLVAGILADATDLLATLRVRDDLSTFSVLSLSAMAGTGTLVGIALATRPEAAAQTAGSTP